MSKENEEPNLGKLVDKEVQQVYWDRDKDKNVLALSLIFSDHVLGITANKDKLIIRLVEQ